MISESVINNLIEALLKKQSEIDWTNEGAAYSIKLPEFILRISRSFESNGIIFEVFESGGMRIGQIIANQNTSTHDQLETLLKAAEAFGANLSDKLTSITKQIETSSGRIGESIFKPKIPNLPTRPSDQQVLELFSKLAGFWDLRYETKIGTFVLEHLRIDNAGNYYIINKIKNTPATQTAIPRFRLVLLSCDDSLKNVELSKQELNGKQKQIEVLTISDSSMSGYAKHDEHKLFYIKSLQ